MGHFPCECSKILRASRALFSLPSSLYIRLILQWSYVQIFGMFEYTPIHHLLYSLSSSTPELTLRPLLHPRRPMIEFLSEFFFFVVKGLIPSSVSNKGAKRQYIPWRDSVKIAVYLKTSKT